VASPLVNAIGNSEATSKQTSDSRSTAAFAGLLYAMLRTSMRSDEVFRNTNKLSAHHFLNNLASAIG